MSKILVVGSKNTYRSIILAEYIKKMLKDRGENPENVSSAGIMAFPDIPAEEEAVKQLEVLGVCGEFRSSPLSKQAVVDSDMIITVSDKIKSAIAGKFPEKAGSVFYIKDMAGEAGELTASESAGAEIKKLVDLAGEKIK